VKNDGWWWEKVRCGEAVSLNAFILKGWGMMLNRGMGAASGNGD
jgi:hypothetical protein